MKTLTNLITKVLIILISTIGVVSCGDSPEELSQKGQDYFKVGNYTEAIKISPVLYYAISLLFAMA